MGVVSSGLGVWVWAGAENGAESVRGGFGGVPSGLDRTGLISLPAVIMDYFPHRWRA